MDSLISCLFSLVEGSLSQCELFLEVSKLVQRRESRIDWIKDKEGRGRQEAMNLHSDDWENTVENKYC